MKRRWILQPNEERKEQVEGQYLVVTKTAGPVELIIGGSTPIEVDLNDRVHLNASSPNDRTLKIKNLSGGINEFEIHTSDLLVDKRTAADLANALISIAPGERIGIDPNANIVQAVIQNAITIDTINNVVQTIIQNAVAIDPNANVVSLQANSLIGIDANANTIKSALLDKQYNALPTQTIVSNAASIPANANRERLQLAADASNTDPIWLGNTSIEGMPLLPGEKTTLDINQALDITGTDGDTLYAAEIVRV